MVRKTGNAKAYSFKPLVQWTGSFQKEVSNNKSYPAQAEVHERVSTRNLVFQSNQPLSDVLSAEKRKHFKLQFSVFYALLLWRN